MNAKSNDIRRIQEMYTIIEQTNRSLAELQMTKDAFVLPKGVKEELIVEGLENRVFRVAEEGGQLSAEAEAYGFDCKSMRGIRNLLAHAYGEIDRRIIWDVLKKDFPALLNSCRNYCADNNIELPE